MLICTNHFQGNILKNDPLNISFIEESSTIYRYNRVKELVNEKSPFTPIKMTELLREQKGINNKELGLGNEKAINQLIAHHSVIFNPEERIMYVSAPPYNLGEYMAYNLNDVFKIASNGCPTDEIDNQNLTIAKDEFIISGKYEKYEEYKVMLEKLQKNNLSKNEEQSFFETICQLNPNLYLSYSSIGDYLKKNKRLNEAANWYAESLKKELPHKAEFKRIEQLYKECI
jgi:hypothetical protein